MKEGSMRKLLVVLVVVALSAAACATSEESETSEETSVPATESGTAAANVNNHGTKTFTSESFKLELELDKFYFSPTFIKSPGGATATLELYNESDVPHTFTIDALNVDEEVQPGAKKEIEVKLGTETRYEFYCRFHKDQGMRGAFQPH
jgi:plastocyanin